MKRIIKPFRNVIGNVPRGHKQVGIISEGKWFGLNWEIEKIVDKSKRKQRRETPTVASINELLASLHSTQESIAQRLA
ncbi:hypothetical protein Bhyg_03670 [Pseudolycoriella hygida]|uniref:Uncharacterized protein n=1 Tax=Pseudolycoriella hygida TaxID=35572 RepID=A0A9Q0S7Q0_9DIPT|nr:hypothetical protein Bhyg_03670 [Pseudolycoriella hygida]